MINIFSDGGCIVGKGIGAKSFVVVEDDKIIHIEGTLIYGSNVTNNIAEYDAVIEALLNYDCCNIYSDSEVVIKQINGEYAVKKPELKIKYDVVMHLIKNKSIKFYNVPRENKYISIANKLNQIVMSDVK